MVKNRFEVDQAIVGKKGEDLNVMQHLGSCQGLFLRDIRSGRDGADTITNIEKLSFADVSRVDLSIGSPLAVKDILSTNSTGQALTRTVAHLLSKPQLLNNDRDWDSDVSQLTITAVLEAKGGTASLAGGGDVLFTPDASYTGVMSFKYTVQDAQGNFTQATNTATGQTETMRAAVYLQTADLGNAVTMKKVAACGRYSGAKALNDQDFECMATSNEYQRRAST